MISLLPQILQHTWWENPKDNKLFVKAFAASFRATHLKDIAGPASSSARGWDDEIEEEDLGEPAFKKARTTAKKSTLDSSEDAVSALSEESLTEEDLLRKLDKDKMRGLKAAFNAEQTLANLRQYIKEFPNELLAIHGLKDFSGCKSLW